MKEWAALLYLEKGHLFQGQGLGAEAIQGGEIVFNTGMSGYQEIFTDPSYCNQIVVMTNPHIGNTGVNFDDTESSALFLKGAVVRDYCGAPSSWRSKLSLAEYFEKAGVTAISGVDTRRLTQVIRSEGAQRAVIFPKGESDEAEAIIRAKKALETIPEMEGSELVSQVSTKSPYEFLARGPSSAGTLVVYDYGVKTNILRSFKDRKYKIWVVPHNFPYQEALALKPNAVVLSNGPGDPATVKGAANEISALIGKIPIFAVCMGHQLLARALGCSTYKLKFGHHGINHPVKDLIRDRILITSQNHGFAVRATDLKQKEIEISFKSLNDDTLEGFHSPELRLYSVQFHPEAKPGPSDASYLFDHFIRGVLQ